MRLVQVSGQLADLRKLGFDFLTLIPTGAASYGQGARLQKVISSPYWQKPLTMLGRPWANVGPSEQNGNAEIENNRNKGPITSHPAFREREPSIRSTPKVASGAWLSTKFSRKSGAVRPKKLHPRIGDERYVAATKAPYREEGILEIDDGAGVSCVAKKAHTYKLGSGSVTLIAQNECLTVLRRCRDRKDLRIDWPRVCHRSSENVVF